MRGVQDALVKGWWYIFEAFFPLVQEISRSGGCGWVVDAEAVRKGRRKGLAVVVVDVSNRKKKKARECIAPTQDRCVLPPGY